MKKKLQLKSETIVVLTHDALDGVVGGAFTTTTTIPNPVPAVTKKLGCNSNGTLCDKAKSWLQACPPSPGPK